MSRSFLSKKVLATLEKRRNKVHIITITQEMIDLIRKAHASGELSAPSDDEMRDDVATGQSLQLSMRQQGLFPHMVIQMVTIGEESGALDDMLAKVADFYQQEVDDAVDALSSLLEPIIMSILGILIGGLVVAMYLPIFKMGAAI